MAYINCEQDHIENEIKHIFLNTMQWTTRIYQLRKGKDKHKSEIKYLLAWMYPSMEEYFRNQRNFTSLRSKIFFTYKKEILKAKAFRTSLT